MRVQSNLSRRRNCNRYTRERMIMTCTCGHMEDEHGGVEDYPGSSKCSIEDCDCVCFEWDGEEDKE